MSTEIWRLKLVGSRFRSEANPGCWTHSRKAAGEPSGILRLKKTIKKRKTWAAGCRSINWSIIYNRSRRLVLYRRHEERDCKLNNGCVRIFIYFLLNATRRDLQRVAFDSKMSLLWSLLFFDITWKTYNTIQSWSAHRTYRRLPT